jgi:hypothetical protein
LAQQQMPSMTNIPPAEQACSNFDVEEAGSPLPWENTTTTNAKKNPVRRPGSV